jgi:hypothetical protein
LAAFLTGRFTAFFAAPVFLLALGAGFLMFQLLRTSLVVLND